MFSCRLGDFENPKDWKVVLGEHHLKQNDWFEQSRSVRAIYSHPAYKAATEKPIDQDTLMSIPPDYDLGTIK